MNEPSNTPEIMTTTLLLWEARLALEGLTRLEDELRHINKTSSNEDDAADAGNDLVQLMIFKNRLEEEAVKAFGESVKDFDNSPI